MKKNDVYITYCLHRGKTGLFHMGKWVVAPFKYYKGYVYDESNFPSFYFKRNALKTIELMNKAAKWDYKREEWRCICRTTGVLLR